MPKRDKNYDCAKGRNETFLKVFYAENLELMLG
jgi:hypothetical protein